MKDVAIWLKELEDATSQAYEHAAQIFENDTKLKKLFTQLAEEERWHSSVMDKAIQFIGSSTDISPAVFIDDKVDTRIQSYVSDVETILNAENIEKAELFEKIFTLELSEWNDLFFYVLETLKQNSNEFKYPAARIQAHLQGIENFVESFEIDGWKEIQARIKKVPPVWIENILIVEDETSIAELIKALLYKSGNIDIASNGEEAMALVETKYYKLIISDVDMPIMDGITFFNETLKKIPTINKRFLFLTGDLSFERQCFFDKCDVNYLAKPAGITKLRDVATQIILSK